MNVIMEPAFAKDEELAEMVQQATPQVEKIYRLWRDLIDDSMERGVEYLKANAPTE